MKPHSLFILAAALLISNRAFAADGEALIKKDGCSACHAVNKKMVGPAFKDVAAKYKGDAAAADKLMKKVRSGGSGSFGSMPMPAVGKNVSDEDVKNIIAWVLTLN